MKIVNSRRGFTLIEVIVVAAIIAILAGILVPMIFNQIDEAKTTKAKGECDTLAKTMQAFRTNTGFWPNRYSGLPTPPDATTLISAGTLPFVDAGKTSNDLTTLGFTPADPTTDLTKYTFTSHMAADNGSYYDATGVNKWKQMLTEAPADPWGNTYICNSIDLEDKNKIVWILSAGQNGILETKATDTVLAGDDVGVKVVH